MKQKLGFEMIQITKTDEHNLWFSQMHRPFFFSTPFEGQDFALLLVVADRAITDDERASVSEEIVRQGCRYAVCTGHQCSKWDDSIDLAYVASDPNFSPPDERFIMTTWHEDEPLEDVALFFRTNTAFADFVPGHFLVLILGGDAGTAQQVFWTIEKCFGPER